ncbi:ABC transporter ATP-binding protein [Tessaracoccus caeni]|uniref:ABC transporter ATP-binding protein n=1 Tax=Tessaracoccus caeni TaxID=3031239 RepID=UPI0023DBEBE2|nr:ABC transporter ATP-binding protein [Tessaracoccus caeni]MDF1488716.1 ABC transporter ATP-binding protein [Tessaracoccus caeni]
MTSQTPYVTGALIVADRLSKSYPVGTSTVDVLHNVSLTVSEGEVCAIMGPSGSGKSTLLYCLAGLEPPSAGDVALLGKSLTKSSRTQLAELRRSDLGFVFQSYNLMPTLPVAENVALPFRLRGERVDKGLVESALTSVGLGGRGAVLPSSMSGGEQQRVAIARVLAQRPKIVFADEPTGALDTRSGRAVLTELRRIGSEPGQCVLIVTHDPAVAAACDRVVFMRDGRLANQMTAPTTEEVASMLAALEESTGEAA